jgi:repressor LexA
MRLPRRNRKQEVYRYLREVLLRGGRPPSVRELQVALGFKSTSTVHFYLKQLEREGLIRRNERASRGIELADNPLSDLTPVPVVGLVTAGRPILAEENRLATLLLPRPFASEETFALRVQGDSMIGAGILDGDTVVVAQGMDVRDGDIVVALIGDEATVKTFRRQGDVIRLEAANPLYPPIEGRDISVLGKVVALLRRYD